MKKIYLFGILFAVFIVIAFFYNRRSLDPIGLYVAKHNVLTIDSLWIENEYYKRSIYDARNGQFLFSNQDKWEFKKGRLLFLNFFPNDDEALKPDYDFNSVLMTFSVPLEKSFGREAFDYDETSAKFRFYKPYF